MENQERNNQEQLPATGQKSPQRYSGLTPQGIASNIEKINEVFPTLSKGFYKILCERIKVHNFTDYELTKAVNHVIDTCKYPNPLVAEFINFLRPDGVIEPVEYEPTPEEIKEAAEAKAIRDAIEDEKDRKFLEHLEEWDKRREEYEKM